MPDAPAPPAYAATADSPVAQLEPRAVWRHFAALNRVPRASKEEERVIAFARRFGESLGLDTRVDAVGNVVVRKPATPGREDRPTVLLQAHLDMVHQQNAGTGHDFAREGIRMRVDGDWVHAEGTTLGADNGLGVALAMAVLADAGTLAHPPLEVLFTVDEETGMTGAKGLEPGTLTARYMLNLDTEDDRELTIGCAGGVDVTARGRYTQEPAPADYQAVRLTVSGLSGGHSGMQIHEGLGNANKLLARLLLAAEEAGAAPRLARFDGGGLRNAIPREAYAELLVSDAEALRAALASAKTAIAAEYATTDPELHIAVEEAPSRPEQVFAAADQARLLHALQACPNGIYRMSPDVPGLVQTSNNLARVLAADGAYEALCLTRSSVDSEKWDQVGAIRAVFALAGAAVTTSGDYPGWTPRPDSRLLTVMRDLYRERFGEEPLVEACHAGLECGLIGEKVPGMEMISFGPNIRGAHGPDERAQISSVQKVWGYLTEALARL